MKMKLALLGASAFLALGTVVVAGVPDRPANSSKDAVYISNADLMKGMGWVDISTLHIAGSAQ